MIAENMNPSSIGAPKPLAGEREERVVDASGAMVEHRFFQDPPLALGVWDRHPGRMLILTVNHPTLGDGRLKPVVVEALKEYLARLERDEVGNQKTDSIELPSGARLDAVAFGPGDLL